MKVQEERPHEDTGRRQPHARQGERPPEKSTLSHLDLGLPTSGTVRNTFLLCKPLSLGCFVIAALGNKHSPGGEGDTEDDPVNKPHPNSTDPLQTVLSAVATSVPLVTKKSSGWLISNLSFTRASQRTCLIKS